MDISRLKKKDLQVWLPMMDGVEVLCKYISQSEFEAISAQSKKIKFDPKSHQRREERDEKKFRSLLARDVVLDWRGLTDDGDDYPCTPENIDYLMQECTEFRLLVMDAPMSLEKMFAAEKEASEKKLRNHLRAKLDYPGVSCEACAESQEVDGITPDCQTERGCLIPPLRPECRRALELRGMIVNLRNLVDPGTVCRMFDANMDDLELLAIIEDELREEAPDGQGHQTADRR